MDIKEVTEKIELLTLELTEIVTKGLELQEMLQETKYKAESMIEKIDFYKQQKDKMEKTREEKKNANNSGS